MATNTTNYNFTLPAVADPIDADLWGGQLNGNWTSLDSLLNIATNSNTRDVSGASESITTADRNRLIVVDASSNAVEIGLLAASSAADGFTVAIKLEDATNALTINPNGAETIDGQSTLVLNNANDAIVIVCDGSNWFVKSRQRASISGDNIESGSATAGSVLVASGSGTSSFAPRPATSVIQSSSQSITASTWTALEFDDEIYDDADWHDNASNNSRITIDADGRYDVSGCYAISDLNNGDVGVAISVNGTRIIEDLVDSGSTNVNRARAISFDSIELSDGDFIEIEAFANGGAINTVANNTRFTVKRVR